MALETATYISDLVSTNPTSSDNISQGDDHIRLLKATVKATFPNVTGAVTSTHTELNKLAGVATTATELGYVSGVTSAIQTQLGTKAPSASPTLTGTIVLGAGDGTGTLTSAILRGAAGTGTNIAGTNLDIRAGNGTGTGGSGYIAFQTAAAGTTGSTANTLTERMRIDNAGNVGIGVTPSAWASTNNGILQMQRASIAGLSNNDLHASSNAYYDNINWRYIASSVAATNYYQNAGSHVWRYAASGTAGNAITWSEAMRIDSSGNVGIGTASPSTYGKFAVVGSTGNGIAYNDGTVTAYLGTSGSNLGLSGTTTNHPYSLYTNASERFRIGTSGQLGIGGATYGTAGQVLTSGGASAAPSWANVGITRATAVTPTTQTTVEFGNIPSTARRITFIFNDMSTNGSSVPIIQLGTSGGFVTSGYVGGGQSASTSFATSTAGFSMRDSWSASNSLNGIATLVNITGNTWVIAGVFSLGGFSIQVAGNNALSGTLTQVRLNTVAGTSAFDAGTINIFYE